MTDDPQDPPPEKLEDSAPGSDIESVWDMGLAEVYGEDENASDKDASVMAALRGRLGSDSKVLLPNHPATAGDSPTLSTRPDESGSIGRYLVLGEIARGGMGVVLKGRDADLGRDVAIKVLKDGYADHSQMLQRFVEEAQIGGQLQHPGVVPVYEMGLDSRHRPYFAMKLVNGRTLASLLAERANPSVELGRYLSIFEQVCQTIAYAHSRNVVHRDVKPANVMVGAFGEVQVVDWGFAKVLTRGGIDDEVLAEERDLERDATADDTSVATVRSNEPGSHSLAGSVLGTPSYMPPEQAQGAVGALDERADVFALGAILCEILTGKPPYVRQPGSDVMEQAAAATLDEAYGRLDDCDADAELIDLARRCLAAERDERPRNAGVVATAITDHIARSEDRTRQAQVATAEARVRATAERKTRRLTVALAASLVVLLACGTIAVFWSKERDVRADRDIRTALTDARDLAAAQSWDAAYEALRRARNGIDSGRGTDETRDEFKRFAARFAEDWAVARREGRDRKFIAALREIQTRSTETAARGKESEYSRVFKSYGINVTDETPERVAELFQAKGRDMAVQMAIALDDWAGRIRSSRFGWRSSKQRDSWKHLIACARLADPHPWRSQLRDAFLANDVDAMRQIASEVDAQEHDPTSLGLLALGLLHKRDRETARDVLVSAFRVHPDNFLINYYLGVRLWGQRGTWDRREPPDPETLDDAFLHTGIALGLQPDNLTVRAHLVRLLGHKGRREEALAHLEELAPRVSSKGGIYMVASRFHALGETARARSELERATGKSADSFEVRMLMRRWKDWQAIRTGAPLPKVIADLRSSLGDSVDRAEVQRELSRALYRISDWAGAAMAAQAALTVHDGDFDARWLLVRCLLRQGQFAQARLIGSESLAQGDDNPNMKRLVAEATSYEKLAKTASAKLNAEALPPPPELLKLARLRLRQGKLDQAQALYVHAFGEKVPSSFRRRGSRARSGSRRTRPEGNGSTAEPGKKPKPDSPARGRGRGRGRRRGPPGRSQPSSDLRDCVSALVRTGVGQGESPETPGLRHAQLRQRALTWLTAELKEAEGRLGKGDRRGIFSVLETWRYDSRLTAVRDEAQLSRLPEDESARWRAAWVKLDNLLQQSRGR
ncbi:MAG: hypothetical protein CMJ83_20650 [Planctomycetes bacterium]|nr:hypothetical protein [Planctomycetota bacterium]